MGWTLRRSRYGTPAEDTPSGADPEDVEATPVFDRGRTSAENLMAARGTSISIERLTHLWGVCYGDKSISYLWNILKRSARRTSRFDAALEYRHMHGLFSFCWPLADFLSQYCFSAKWTDVLAFPFLVALGHGTAKPPGNMANTEMSEGNMKGACHSGTAGHRRLFSKGNFGACHALAQSAKQFKRQRLLCRGLGTDRVSRGVDCPADFAFSRLTGRGQPDWRFGIWGSRR
jgi:hypothetical protein